MGLNSCNQVGTITGTNQDSSFSLSTSGDTLVYSNNPESLTSTSDLADAGAYLYRDVSPGRTRAWFHHENSISGTTIYFVVRIVNNQVGSSVDVYLNRTSSGSSSSSGSSPSTAGGAAWAAWFTNSPNGTDTYQTTITNGGTYDIYASSGVSSGDVLSGIVDFVCTNPSTGAAVAVDVVIFAYSSTSTTPTSAAALNPTSVGGISYGSTGYAGPVRGTFSNCSRTGSFTWDSSSGSQYLELFSLYTSAQITGEYQSGTDATNGDTVYIDGNFGIDYNITFTLNDNASPACGTVYGYLQDTGGTTTYALRENGNTIPSTGYCGPDSTSQAYNFDTTALNGGSTQYTIQIVLPGGSSGPQQLYWAC